MTPLVIDPVASGTHQATAAQNASADTPRATTRSSSQSSADFAAAMTTALGSNASAKTAAAHTNPSSSTGSTVTGDMVVANAKQYLGVPYVWGGTTSNGLDCSGLVQLTFKNLGIDLPRVSRDQAKSGTAVPSMDQARPGDLIAFGSPVNHIAIYVGDGKILEAPQAGQDVHIGPIHRTPTAIRRIVEPGDGSMTIPSAYAATGSTGIAADSAVVPAPELLSMFDAHTLAQTPRAVALSTMAAGSADTGQDGVSVQGASASYDASLLASNLIGAGTGGFNAAQLSAAGMSDKVAALAGQFATAEDQYQLPAGLLAAVAQAESGGDSAAVSSAGAQGLMQLMPGTAAGLGVTDPFDPGQAITGAAKLLARNLDSFGGSVPLALAAYNAGAGAVTQYGGVPPYAETQNYVSKITAMLERLQ